MMRRLADTPEHLDGELVDQAILDGNLRDLARINRRFGGTELSIRALRELVASRGGTAAPIDVLRVLDVGTGAGDIPTSITAASGPWRSTHVMAVDSRPEVIEGARRVNAALDLRKDVELAVADGRALPFDDDAFDVAHASLVLHHVEPGDAVAFLRELARVARLGVVVNDLARGPHFWLGAWLILHMITRNPWTLHDGTLSVRRAYTRAEARALLVEAGLRPMVEVVGFAGYRWAIGAARG